MTTQVTSISARGYVVADYDTATFNLTFHEYASKSRDAKSKLKKGVEEVTSTLESLKRKGLVILGNTYRTNVSVAPHFVYRGNENKLAGQDATYTLTFQTPTLEMVSETYDCLSEIGANELTVQSPTFQVRKEADLKQEALDDAWMVAQKLFSNQCKTLNLDSTKYLVTSWSVQYANDRGVSFKGRNFSNSTIASLGDEDSFISLNAGRAVVDVVLTVNYSQTGS